MCGRFTSYHSNAEIAKAFDLADVPHLEPRYNIAPTNTVATILRSDSQSDREFKWLRWGLIPHWAKEQKIGNSRSLLSNIFSNSFCTLIKIAEVNKFET
ncbi:MAG: SOS response-associated peptidase family protein [Xenococcaceae cyanobacterium MO_188.B29]|nr:SOS response-associated peptidase family protein [Xenococcaceae cyanobacterium MO_188.B29]